MSNESLSAIEEQAIDALLSEVIPNESAGPQTPPDLSDVILKRLAEGDFDDSSDDEFSDSGRVATVKSESALTIPGGGLTVFAGALAATLAFAIYLSPKNDDRKNKPSETTIAGSDTQDLPRSETVEPIPSPDTLLANGTNADRTPTGMPRVLSDKPDAGQDATSSTGSVTTDSVTEVASLDGQPQELTLVSQSVNQTQREYWDAIGVQPTGQAVADEISARLQQSLGITIDPETLGDINRLQKNLAAGSTAKTLARRWLNHVTQGGLGAINGGDATALVDSATKSFQGQQPLDTAMVGWMTGESPDQDERISHAWYAAMAAGGRPAMVRKLARVSLGVDLRCTQCHDGMVDQGGKQEDYWSFRGFVEQGVQPKNRRWTVLNEPANKQRFFELPDGRQRAVAPAISEKWMSAVADHRPDNLKEWSWMLSGSRELASGIVNSLWKMVHGRALKASLVDPENAPVDDSLNQLHDQLVDDLLASHFNVNRTMALIIGSPMSQLSVPEELMPENALVVSDADHRSAKDRVQAFAASLPPEAQLARNLRIDLAMRRIGGRLDAIESQTFLAQPSESPGAKAPKNKPANQPAVKTPLPLVSGFPERVDALPVHWLQSIDDFDSQVQHLAYLAGKDKLPADLQKTIEALQKSEADRDLTLHRIWWLLQP